MRQPLCEADVGGGAWRLKWHPSPKRKNDVLVACMHDGFKVLRFPLLANLSAAESTTDKWSLVKRFDEHESLAYGADWSYEASTDHEETLIATCSFYDHLLCTWRG